MNIKHFLVFLTILFSQVSFAQNRIDDKLEQAKNAVEAKDYTKAIKKYKKLIRKDEYNADLQLDLADLLFLINDVESGCDCAHIANMFGNKNAEALINSKCISYPAKVKLLKDVDSPPMFLYQGQYYNLIENYKVNPLYSKAIMSELALYDKKYSHGLLFNNNLLIKVKINNKGKFAGEVVGYQDNIEQLKIRKDIINVVNNKIFYKPAFYDNKPIEIFNSFPLQMERN